MVVLVFSAFIVGVIGTTVVAIIYKRNSIKRMPISIQVHPNLATEVSYQNNLPKDEETEQENSASFT